MAGTLSFLGIHEGDIEHASDVLEAVCDKHGIHSDCVWSAVLQEFEDVFGDNFENHVIDIMFQNLRDKLLDIDIPDDSINWEVNGICSDFYIDGEQAY